MPKKKTRYAVNYEKLPKWAVRDLDRAGIPKGFRIKELSDEQAEELCFILTLVSMQEEGYIKIDGEGENVSLTSKGEAMLKEAKK